MALSQRDDGAAARGESLPTLLLFDLDGTLTKSRLPATLTVLNALRCLKRQARLGVVSSSDYQKIVDQLGVHSGNVFEYTDYIFAENGIVAREAPGRALGDDLKVHSVLGEQRYQELVQFVLHYIADLDLPMKRGTFLELRTGIINISPLGRNCTIAERQHFADYDATHRVRETFVEKLREKFSDFGLCFAIGGQISIDCYPHGWDKRFCLQRLPPHGFRAIHFFGDRTKPGGNDYELYSDSRVIGHSVTSPADTLSQVQALGYHLTEESLDDPLVRYAS